MCMDAGKWIYILVMGWATIIYGGLTYIIVKKKDLVLLNGYGKRSAEEKKYLHEHGYIRAVNRLLTYTFWLFFATFIVGLFPIPFGFEVGITLFTVVLLAGLVWIQRYEVPHKRKRMYWISGSLAIGTIVFVGWIAMDSFTDNSFHITEDTLEVTGPYGFEWELSAIEEIDLLDGLPEVRLKTNGTSIGGLAKGKFRLEEPYGTGRLLIQNAGKTNDVIYLQTTDDFVMISRKTDEDTMDLYERLKKAIH